MMRSAMATWFTALVFAQGLGAQSVIWMPEREELLSVGVDGRHVQIFRPEVDELGAFRLRPAGVLATGPETVALARSSRDPNRVWVAEARSRSLVAWDLSRREVTSVVFLDARRDPRQVRLDAVPGAPDLALDPLRRVVFVRSGGAVHAMTLDQRPRLLAAALLPKDPILSHPSAALIVSSCSPCHNFKEIDDVPWDLGGPLVLPPGHPPIPGSGSPGGLR